MKTIQLKLLSVLALPLLLAGCATDGGVVDYPPVPCGGIYCSPVPPPYYGGGGYPVHRGAHHGPAHR